MTSDSAPGPRSRSLPETRTDVDGWNSLDPRWRERVDATSLLALTVEALRRIVELRDVLAESGSTETVRALMLNGVISALYEVALRERVGDDAPPVPRGSGASLVRTLYDAGIMTPDEYRSVV